MSIFGSAFGMDLGLGLDAEGLDLGVGGGEGAEVVSPKVSYKGRAPI